MKLVAINNQHSMKVSFRIVIGSPIPLTHETIDTWGELEYESQPEP